MTHVKYSCENCKKDFNHVKMVYGVFLCGECHFKGIVHRKDIFNKFVKSKIEMAIRERQIRHYKIMTEQNNQITDDDLNKSVKCHDFKIKIQNFINTLTNRKVFKESPIIR
jgi:DNA-directed RNA polymerase subunit RPC12/RpoP